MSIARAGTSLLRIRYMSDLHLEFSDFTPPPLEADIVMLAGDIHTGTESLDWAARSFPETPVLYLPGNHEYYGFATNNLPNGIRAANCTIHNCSGVALSAGVSVARCCVRPGSITCAGICRPAD